MTAPSPSERPGPAPQLAGCLEACRRCREVVRLVGGRPRAELSRLRRLVGPQLRHCAEHVRAVLDGLDSGVVDYHGRARDTRLEGDLGALEREFERSETRLIAIAPGALAVPLTVRDLAAPDSVPVEAPSSLSRELVFLSSHTIHHLAILETSLAALGVTVPGELGVAYSTRAAQSIAGPR